ncbi:MAG: tetratricopeptide repeat protein [Spirochaetes bacterium]|nr:tetratricopeptide repeat protein [Spirochaetota bacterium]
MSKTDLNERIKTFLNSALKKISAKDYDSALERLSAAEALDKDNPEILYNLGICYCRKKLYNSAITYLKKVRGLPLTFVDVLTVIKMLSYSLIMANDYDQAKKHIDDGLNISKDDTVLLNMRGYIFEKENNYAEALNTYKFIIDIDKNNSNAYNSIAYIISETDSDLDEALSHARNALKYNPENPAYLDTMGCIQMKRGQIDIAKRYLKKALEKVPDSKEIKDHINRLLKINPDSNE